MTEAARARLYMQVKGLVAGGVKLTTACSQAGISRATFDRWDKRWREGGIDGLADLPRSGRPPLVDLDAEEREFLRSTYIRSNRNKEAGSMTFAARWSAKNPASPLKPETREAILKPRASKHTLPVEVRRACRASGSVVARYRGGAKAGQNDGIYTPGWLRMADDGSRRLVPGERQVWDDASVNVGVWVPWARGGDRTSERYGCRVGRFQLLASIDCATDMCVGYQFVMRDRDAYNAADVCGSLYRTWKLAGYVPNECVMEGGSWQSERTRSMLDAAGVRLISAKGRPNQKLVEGWFNRLWTVMSVELPKRGQVGRCRGEMDDGNKNWLRCRDGRADPREFFPSLTEFLAALDRSIIYLNSEVVESREYGVWTPGEVYAAQAAKGHEMPQGLARYALPVRELRTVGRGGTVKVAAECVAGWRHDYIFAADKLFEFIGAPVRVSFDPAEIGGGAVIELASGWRGHRPGEIISMSAECISAAPELIRTGNGYVFNARDARRIAANVKRRSRALIGAQAAAHDESGVRARHASAQAAPDAGMAQSYGIRAAAAVVPQRIDPRDIDLDASEDFTAAEKQAVGIW